MKSEEGDGFKLWWQLKREYESTVPGRHQAMFMALLKPEHWKEMSASQFEQALVDWELDFQNYEKQSGKAFDDDNCIATILNGAPPFIKQSLNSGLQGSESCC